MKKLFLFILLLAPTLSYAQCTPAFGLPDTWFTFDLNNPFDYNYGETLGPHPYWQPKCGTATAQLSGTYRYVDHRKVRVSFELYKEEFDCSGVSLGSPTFITATPLEEHDGVPVIIGPGDPTVVLIDCFFIQDIDPSKNIAYTVRMKYKKKFLTGWGSWNYVWSENVRIIPTATPPTPNGYFTDVLSTESRTSTGTGWTINVNQLDFNGARNFIASPTSCENKWKYEISRFDLDSWTTTNTVISPWIDGEAGTIDMTSFYTYGLEQNKLYQLKLIAGNGWYDKYYYFELKGAVLVGSLATNSQYASTETVTIGSQSYLVYLKCENLPVKLNTTGTESVDEYRVRVGRVNPVTFATLGYDSSTGIQPGPVPAEVNLNALYAAPFILGQVYRVVYEVTSPGSTEIYYFRTRNCTPGNFKQLPVAGDSQKENDFEIKLYPNPVSQKLNIELPKTDLGYHYEIFNQLGQSVLNEHTVTQKLSINLNNWSNGLYFIKLENKMTHKITSLKFMKE